MAVEAPSRRGFRSREGCCAQGSHLALVLPRSPACGLRSNPQRRRGISPSAARAIGRTTRGRRTVAVHTPRRNEGAKRPTPAAAPHALTPAELAAALGSDLSRGLED